MAEDEEKRQELAKEQNEKKSKSRCPICGEDEHQTDTCPNLKVWQGWEGSVGTAYPADQGPCGPEREEEIRNDGTASLLQQLCAPWGLRLAVTPPELFLRAKLEAVHKDFVARKIAAAEAQAERLTFAAKAEKETGEAVSLTVGTAAFEARYRKAIAEWKLVCDISDTDCG